MKKDVEETLDALYKKIRLLKSSASGEVWQAMSNLTDEIVVIKRVRRTGLPYSAIQHADFKLPAKIFLCAEDESETVIVEEFIQGETLIERLKMKKFFTGQQTREILLQMCDGLRELHAANIIHRDITPANMILQGTAIRLIDFDAARVHKVGQKKDTRSIGTEGYASPEQLGDRQSDARSDIYSLGMTMRALLDKNCDDRRLKKILAKCTKYDPEDRYQNVDELQFALTTVGLPVKIFVSTIVAAIIFSVNAPSLNHSENFFETVVTRTDNAPEKNSTPAPVDDSFKFREIILPSTTPSSIEIPAPKIISPPTTSPRQNFSRTTELPQIPAITLPPVTPPTVEVPAPQPIPSPAPRKISSGLIRTQLFFNEEPYDQFEHLHQSMPMTRDDWKRSGVRLRLTNDTGAVWPNPTIKYVIGQNWGDKLRDTITLPSLADGASADFVIPFNFDVSDRKNTDTYIQIWLGGEEKKLDEHYWSIRFKMLD